MKKSNTKNRIAWVIILVMSLAVLFLSMRFVATDFHPFTYQSGAVLKAKVIEVDDPMVSQIDAGLSTMLTTTRIPFTCVISQNGWLKGKTVECQQVLDDMISVGVRDKEVEVGDIVMVFNGDPVNNSQPLWYFSGYYRFDRLVILACVFALLVLLIGKTKGIKTLLSLSMTFAYIFFVFVPAVMNARNAYLWGSITCLYIIVMTLFILNGVSKKSIVTIIGCVAGTAFSAVLFVVMSKLLCLTGLVDEHAMYLLQINPDKQLNLVALLFAAVTIGAMGAIMDVAMDISSSLFEIHEHNPSISFKKLFRSGMNIGRDIMGTMANTLILAYIGSSLSSTILLITYSSSATHLLNREVVIVEILQALIGSFGILLTIPLTVVACGSVYLRSQKLSGRSKADNNGKTHYWKAM